MLVLTQKPGEQIRIDGNIIVKVIRTGTRVKLGFEAPPDVRIERERKAA